MQHLQTPIATYPNNDCNITELYPRLPRARSLAVVTSSPQQRSQGSGGPQQLASPLGREGGGWHGGEGRTSRRCAKGARPAEGAMVQGRRTARPLSEAGSGGGGSPALQPQGAPDVGGQRRSAQGRRRAREEGRRASGEGSSSSRSSRITIMAAGRRRSAPTTTSGAGGECPIFVHTPREEAKQEGMERWSSGDHRSGLGSGRGDRRREIRRWRWRAGWEAARGRVARYERGGRDSFFLFLAI
jgi:hypothetical protein